MKDWCFKFLLLTFLIGVLTVGESFGQDSLISKSKATYQYDFFNEDIPNWNTAELELTLLSKAYTILPRITLTRRFGKNGLKLETDVYKKLKNEDYINFGVGYSPVDIFPRAKVNFEYYNPFAKTWEHSLGVSVLSFETSGWVGVGTASLSKYYGSFLTILRGNVAYGEDANGFTGAGGVLMQRYYINDVKYLGVFGAYGYDASLLAVIENLRFGESPDQISVGILYQADRKRNGQWDFSYSWTRYNFKTRSRDQHTLRVSYAIHYHNRN